MFNTDIDKQREIGKQLFMIDIIHYENDRSIEGGLSFLSRDKLAACAVIKAFNDIGRTLDETVEQILGKSEYKGITEEYITEKFNMFSAKH